MLVERVAHIRPGKAQVYLRPEANRLLERAIALYGRPIFPTGSMSAGRTRAQQLVLWERAQNGGPVASHPDRGPRPHMRYGALDIDDRGAIAAMKSAGWVATTPSEWWHFEHPACRTWPIVTDPQTAQDDPEGDDMAQGAFYRNKTNGGIWWQEKPNTPLIPIDLPTWTAYSANGNKYADLEPAAVTALIGKWGQAPAPVTGGGGGDLTPVLRAVDAVPAATVDELKGRL